VPRALEAICLKAMARRPEDRYATPRALADEIERWLADEPVLAYRAPLWARMGRWTRRHKTPVAGAAAVMATALVALAAGFAIVTLQKQETERQRARAEANFRKAGDAVEQFLARVGQERLKDVPQMESLRGELLEDALQFQLGFLTERSDDPVVLYDVARAARIAANLLVQFNHVEDAKQSCRQAIAVLDRLAARSPRERSYRRERAMVLETMGLALDTLSQTSDAEASYRQSIDLWSMLNAEQPGSVEDRRQMASCLHHLGILLRGVGRFDEAEQVLQRGRLLLENGSSPKPEDPRVRQGLVAILNQLGLLSQDRGRRAEALENYAHAVEIQRGLVQASSHDSSYRGLLISLLLNQANLYSDNGQLDGAERLFTEAHDLAERLRTDFPSIARYQSLAASVLNNLSNTIKVKPARRSEARDALTRAVDIQEKLVAMAPSVPDHLSKLATMIDGLANLLREQNQLVEAEALYHKVISYQARLAAEHPQSLEFRFGHGQALHNLADVLRERGRPVDALPLAREAVKQLGSLYKLNVQDPAYRSAISYAYWTLCAIERDLKDHRAASQSVAEYLQIKPNGHEEALESVKFLCRCVELCRADQSIPATERNSLSHSYADRSMDALRTAVRNGFRDANDLKSSRSYEPLRARDDFQRLIEEVEAKTKAEGQAR
jgi:eukaryotic-like serine/threonine-protein kinase